MALLSTPGPLRGDDAGEDSPFLPAPITEGTFTDLFDRSPFARTLNLPNSLILTGMALIEEEAIATLFDVQTLRSYTIKQGEMTVDGWQLIEIEGDPSDVESLTARVKVAGADVFSVRYDEAPQVAAGRTSVRISTRIGNGTVGGGTGPHGGPDPRVLTPDQLKDARNAARNIRDGFQADGYPDNTPIPPEVLSKLSKLSSSERESINVRMFEYRNRGLGMPERRQIYNRMIDSELGNR